MNDLIRGKATDPETGRIKLAWELVAGGMAGGCQVVSGGFDHSCCDVFYSRQRQGVHESSGDSV